MLNEMIPGNKLVTGKTARDARIINRKRNFSFCLINTPLSDEFGDELAREISLNSICQVILVVKKDLYESALLRSQKNGVFLLQKPIVRSVFESAVSFSIASLRRMERISEENAKLSQKIDDIKIVDRAKCVLIEVLRMREQDAHRYIEKQAMDMRQNKRIIAERIINTYET